MSDLVTTNNVPKDLRARRAWVIFQLRCKGLNLTVLAEQEGVSRQVMAKCLTTPNARAEDVVAAAIGLTAPELFPERFDSAGERLFRVRGPQRSPHRAAPSRRKAGGR